MSDTAPDELQPPPGDGVAGHHDNQQLPSEAAAPPPVTPAPASASLGDVTDEDNKAKKKRRKAKKKARERRQDHHRGHPGTPMPSTNLEVPASADAAPVPFPFEQIAKSYDDMKADIKRSVADTLDDIEAQTHHLGNVAASKKSDKAFSGMSKNVPVVPETMGGDEAPMYDEYAARCHDDVRDHDKHEKKKKPENIEDSDAPLTDERAAMMYEGANANAAKIAATRSNPNQGVAQRRNNNQNTSTRSSQPVSPQNDENNITSIPPLEATLVQGVEATLIVEEEPASTNMQDRSTVYEATIVPPQEPLEKESSSVDESRLDENLPWWKQHQKCILVALAMAAIAIVAILSGVLIKSSGKNEEQIPLVTTQNPTTPNPTSRPTMKPTVSPTTKSLSWIQTSRAINSNATGDRFGHALGISSDEDGNIIAIGADGYVRVYTTSPGAIVAFDVEHTITGEPGTNFGSALALSADGRMMATGASYFNGNSTETDYFGQVKVFRLVDNDPSSWMQVGNVISGDNDTDRLGESVSLSADGTFLGVSGGGSSDSYARVYHLDPFDLTWKSDHHFPNATSTSLSSDGTTLVVSYHCECNLLFSLDPEDICEAARVYQWDAVSKKYDLLQNFEETSCSGFNSLSYLDESVAISSDGATIAIGIQMAEYGLGDPHSSRSLSVQLYSWDDSEQQYTMIGSFSRTEGVLYSYALSRDGKSLAMGDAQIFYGANGVSYGRGEVDVYRRDEKSFEFEKQGQTLTGPMTGSRFGYSLALSSDGNTLTVGAEYADKNDGDSGQVKIFTLGY